MYHTSMGNISSALYYRGRWSGGPHSPRRTVAGTVAACGGLWLTSLTDGLWGKDVIFVLQKQLYTESEVLGLPPKIWDFFKISDFKRSHFIGTATVTTEIDVTFPEH